MKMRTKTSQFMFDCVQSIDRQKVILLTVCQKPEMDIDGIF